MRERREPKLRVLRVAVVLGMAEVQVLEVFDWCSRLVFGGTEQRHACATELVGRASAIAGL